MHLLLAEDERINQLYMTDLLEREGHTVSVAADGASVLEQVEQTAFDLILMDIQMPIMGGLEATGRIRDSDGLATPSTVPILAMTAYSSSEDRSRFLAAGVTEIVPKPIVESALLALLTSISERDE